jgi:hypothetical protein
MINCNLNAMNPILSPPLMFNRSLNYTPLHYACANGHTDACKLLLQCAADVEATENQ